VNLDSPGPDGYHGIRPGSGTVAITPFRFRKAAQNPAQRKLVIPFGGTGYVALYEIVSASKVVVLATRHQREKDYH
jgi:hypothetical protein